MKWYYLDAKQKVGPVDDAEIGRLVGEGVITAETHVWNELIAEWQPYGRSGELKDDSRIDVPGPARKIQSRSGGSSRREQDSAGAARTLCSECGRSFPEDEVISYSGAKVCAACKPSFFQKVREGTQLSTAMQYAGFWIRFGAKFIDGIIQGMANMLISFVAGVATGGAITSGTGAPGGQNIAGMIVVFLIQMSIPIAYTTYFLGRFGATPGKMVCGLKVVMSDGQPVSYKRGLGRYFAEILSSLTLLIGYIIAAFDDEKKALHDRICNTRVIRN